MPKTNGRPDSWENQLRKLLKREHGRGWSIGEQSNKVKLSYRDEEGERRSLMLDVPWSVSSSTAIANEVAVIRACMTERGLGLREAHDRCRASEGRKAGHGVVVSSTDWQKNRQEVPRESERKPKKHHSYDGSRDPKSSADTVSKAKAN